MELYQHQPLQSSRNIRLCELGPSRKSSAPLNCRLFEFPIEQTPRYEALSYHCGQTFPPGTILCSGRRLDITQNCVAALRRLRLEKEPRVLWIDSICISQCDKLEKSHQVQMMTQIYQKASEVWIWVGESSMTLDGWLGATTRITEWDPLRPKIYHSRDGNVDLQTTVGKAAGNAIAAGVTHGIVKPLMFFCIRVPTSKKRSFVSPRQPTLDFFSRSVFDRMWCFQEAAVSSRIRILCGTTSLTWEQLMKSIEYHKAHSVITADTTHQIFARKIALQDALRNIIYPKPGQAPTRWPSVSSVLDNTRFRGAAEPRDKIYALFGLFRMMGFNPPLPDYNKPIRQIYQEATLTSMNCDRNLDILYQVTGLPNQLNLPSWVPDFSNTKAPVIMVTPALRTSKSSVVQWQLYERSNALCIPGTTVDRVTAFAASMSFTNSSAAQTRDSVITGTEKTAAFSIFKQWLSLVQSLPSYPNGQQPSETFGLILSSACNTHGKVELSTILEVYNHWYNVLGNSNSYSNSIFMEKGVDNMVDHIETYSFQADEQIEFALQHAAGMLLTVVGSGTSMQRRIRALHYWLCLSLRGKALFVTEKGYMGLAPGSVASGDLVILLSGLRTPFLARFSPEEDNSISSRLVAPAFVAGMMEGELWSESRVLDEFMFV